MVHDSSRQLTLLFGGERSGSGSFNETWEYGSPLPVAFPSGVATTEGNAFLSYPFALARSRIQVLMEAPGFPRTETAMIGALELRRDQGPATFAARQIDLRVLLGHPSTTAETMSTQFVSNWQGTPTLVFLGRLSVPAQAAVPAGPAPFNIRIPFGNPVAWAGEDLMYEIDAQNNTVVGIGTYELDAVLQPPPTGFSLRFGQACAGPSGTPVYLTPDPARIIPGGAIENRLQNGTRGSLAVHLLGDSNTRWAGLPLPIAWPGSSCTFYTSVALSAFAPVSAAGTAQVIWPIPNTPGLAGSVVFGQWGIVEGPTTYPPLTMTDAFRFIVGARPPVLFEAIANTTGSGTGSKSSAGNVTLVTRLVFQ